jgi:hypothetical protein
MRYSERGRRRRSRGPSTIGASENWLRVPDQRIETSMGMAPNADVRPRWGENLDRVRQGDQRWPWDFPGLPPGNPC